MNPVSTSRDGIFFALTHPLTLSLLREGGFKETMGQWNEVTIALTGSKQSG